MENTKQTVSQYSIVSMGCSRCYIKVLFRLCFPLASELFLNFRTTSSKKLSSRVISFSIDINARRHNLFSFMDVRVYVLTRLIQENERSHDAVDTGNVSVS